MKTKFAIILAVVSSTMSHAASYIDGNWEWYVYSESNHEGIISKYNGSETSVSVPSSFVRRIQTSERDEDGNYKWKTVYYKVVGINAAFQGNATLEEVTIPSSITSLGWSLFDGCKSLKTVNILGSITEIPVQCFRNCTSLETFVIPSSVKSIRSNAFYGCSKWQPPAVLPSGITSIEERAFWGCQQIQNVSLGANITSLGESSFECCTNIVSVSVDSPVKLPYRLFANCSNIVSVTIGGTVKDLGASGYLHPFFKCPMIKTFSIGSGITTIPSAYFHNGWSGVTGLGSSNDCFPASATIERIDLPETITGIGYSSFEGCVGLTELGLTIGIKTVGASAFKNCRNLKFDNDWFSTLVDVGSSAFEGCYRIVGDIDLSQTKSIGSYAFSNCTRIRSVKTSNSLMSLGSYAFAYCSNLETAEIQGSNLDLYNSSFLFRECPALRFVTFGDGVTRLHYGSSLNYYSSSGTFPGCINLEQVTVGTGVHEVPSCFLYNGSGNRVCGTKRKISASFAGILTKIGYSAFCNSSITNLDMTLKSCTIDSDSFSYCPAASTNCVNFCEAVSIGSYAFQGCANIVGDLDLAAAKSIGDSAFSGCSGITSVKTSAVLTSLGRFAFSSCSNLKEADIQGTNLDLYYSPYIFSHCLSLERATFGDGITRLSYETVLSSIDCSGTFPECTNLQFVSVGKGVREVPARFLYGSGQYACGNAEKMMTVSFAGDITNVAYSAFNCGRIAVLDIPLKSCRVWGSAFAWCPAVNSNSVDFSQVASINDWYAFEGCRNLFGDLDLSHLTNLTLQAFSQCSGISSVKLSEKLTSIPTSCFSGCSSLKSLAIPKSVTKIQDRAFSGDSALSSVFFEGSPPTMGANVFSGVAAGARGHYPRTLADKWLPQIDSNGKWNGLLMHELSQPVLRVESACPAYGTITLAWDDGTDGQCVSSYSIYRGPGTVRLPEYCVASNITETIWTDNDYWKAEPVLSPLNYWVVAESDHFDIPESNRVETRHRYGLSVGFGAYETGDTPLVQAKNDALLAVNNMRGMARFKSVLGRYDSAAKVSDIRRWIQYFSGLVKTGDTFVFYISTHGHDKGTDRKVPVLAAYDGLYALETFQQDMFAITNTATLVEIVMACHSEGLVDGALATNAVKWLSSRGFGQCRANTAWIAACGVDQVAPTYGDTYSSFGEWFLNQGWKNGMADRKIYGFPNYNGGNTDNVLSLLEVAEYASRFACGLSDAAPAELKYENENILSKVLVGAVPNIDVPIVPDTPQNLIASNGEKDSEITLKWDASDRATAYRIFRSEPADSLPKICRSYSYREGTAARDSYLLTRFNQYTYCVRALNPSGISGESNYAMGWAGSASFLRFLWHQYLGNNDVDEVNIRDFLKDGLISAQELSVVAKASAANNMGLYECYVAGLDPTDPDAKFEATIEMDADGKPVVKWNPPLTEEDAAKRTYRTLGKKTLDPVEDWTDVTDETDLDAAGWRFFKVKVEMK